MALDFDGVDDSVELSYSTHGTLRTYSFHFWYDTKGENSEGRLFDKRVSAATDVEIISFFSNAGIFPFSYRRRWSGGQGAWQLDTDPTASAWHVGAITYDAGATTNDPVWWLDGSKPAMTELITPSGTLNTNTDNYVLGNRKNDTARSWDGRLCEFAIWDRILSDAELEGITGDNFSPLFYPASLVAYVPLVRALNDYKNAAATAVGAVAIEHPRVIYPQSVWEYRKPAGAAPAVVKPRHLLTLGVGI